MQGQVFREALGLTQEQLATNLGVASATISRWESGHQIQQLARDRLLRLYFAYPNVRALYSAVNRRRTGRSRTSTFTGEGSPQAAA